MTEEELQALTEVKNSATPVSHLHPLRLDRWWQALVGAPEAIYMQMGCGEIFQQVDSATRAITAMMDLLGASNIPVSHHELAQRHIGRFLLHVPREGEPPAGFLMNWEKQKQNWEVTTPLEEGTTKIVENLEQAVEVCQSWAPNLKKPVEDEPEVPETTEDS